MKNTRNFLACGFLVIAVLLLFSCAGVESDKSCFTGKEYGFLSGLIHGFITPVSFIASLFKADVAIYAVNNSGGWYDLGFLLGSGGWGFLVGSGSKKK
jgi:hypothetical protein